MADPLTGAPDKPDWLDPIAAEEWDRLISLLTERRVISRADGMALELLCLTYALWRAVVSAMAESGPTTETGSGTFKASPESIAADRLGRQLLAWLREFGLTPASRHSVTPIVDVVADPLGEFLSRRDDPVAKFIKLS
jgi:P27 family predicted phage terminase small subunit